MATTEIDMITKRPRTARNPYTSLTEQQILNIKQNPGSFFDISKIGWTPSRTPYKNGERAIRKHFSQVTNENLLRGATQIQPFCWIDKQITRSACVPRSHNTSRLGASVPWGPEKQGARTLTHTDNEETWRYVNLNMYSRPPTNIPGEIHMKHGRPNQGYYAQRFSDKASWFQTSATLNDTEILKNIHRKTTDEYDYIRKLDQDCCLERRRKFPEYSEYTDRFLLRTKVRPKPRTFIDRKKIMLQRLADEEEDDRVEAEEKQRAEEKARRLALTVHADICS